MSTPPDNVSGGSPRVRSPGAVPLAAVTLLSFAVFGTIAIAMIARDDSSYLILAAALCLMSAALVATISVRAIAHFVSTSSFARFAFGLDAVLLAGTTCAGLVVHLVFVTSPSALGITGYVTFVAFALGAASIALHGVMIAFGSASPDRLLSFLRSLKPDRNSGAEPTVGEGGGPWTTSSIRALQVSDLSPAGCCIAVITCLVIFGGGIPLAIWLYGGKRPGIASDELLALPIIALALLFVGVCFLVARLLGVRLLRRG